MDFAQAKTLSPTSEFWAGRRVFITGHTGFKGSWLTLFLEFLGAEVYAYALAPPTEPNLFTLVPSCAGQTGRSTINDVRDLKSLTSALKKSKADVAFHLAAQAIVGRSYQDPLATYEINVLGTANFLEALRSVPSVKSAVIITSDKCYADNGGKQKFKESHPMGGDDPYSSSKGCAELVAASYRRSFFQDGLIATARAGNVFGGGDWAEDRLIPQAMEAFAKKQTLVLRRPGAVRPWQHVLEPLAGYLMLAQGLYEGQPWASAWNFGPSAKDHWPVARLIEHLSAQWGPEASWQGSEQNFYSESQILSLSAAKARRILGWRPRLGLLRALDWTVAWYRAFYHGTEDVSALTKRQIAMFSQLL